MIRTYSLDARWRSWPCSACCARHLIYVEAPCSWDTSDLSGTTCLWASHVCLHLIFHPPPSFTVPLFQMMSQGLVCCQGQTTWILSLPCPLPKPDHTWSAAACTCPCLSFCLSEAVLCAAFKHLGVTVLQRVTAAISYYCGSSAASERSMADAQPFCSASIAADCTSSSVCSAPQLVHPEVFPILHRILLLAVNGALLP